MRGPGSRLLRARALLVWFAVGCGPSSGGSAGDSSGTAGGTSTGGTEDGSTTVVAETGAATSGIGESTSSPTSTTSSGVADSTTGFVSHCEVPPDTPPECWERICDVFVCGPPASLYDAEGCPRAECESASDCAAPTFCSANVLSAPCKGGEYGWFGCEVHDGECVCGGSLGCGPDPRGYCLAPPIEPEDVCTASEWPCDELDQLVAETHQALIEIGADMSDELLAQARDCQWRRMRRLSDECFVGFCEMLCDVLPSYTGCSPPGCSSCGGADPAEVLELMQTIVERSLVCADCALCTELDNAACASLMGC